MDSSHETLQNAEFVLDNLFRAVHDPVNVQQMTKKTNGVTRLKTINRFKLPITQIKSDQCLQASTSGLSDSTKGNIHTQDKHKHKHR